MKKYRVTVSYTFLGSYLINAESPEQATKLADDQCGLVMGGSIHTTLDDDEVEDWNFPIHPESEVVSVKQFKKRKPL